MKVYHYSLQELGVKTIDLGKRGENKVREIEFDLRDWIAEYPGASVALYISQPNTTVYLATTNMVDGVLKWPIIDTYTAIPGFGDAEIVLSGADGERLKSVTASIFVSDSLSDGAPGEAPDYMKPYVDQVAENAAKVEEALEEIKNIGTQSGNMPAGGSSGQILAKKSAENYDTHWIDPPSGSGTGGGVADSVAWDNVTGKPDTYPPASHTHPGYLGKNETAANAAQLNGKSADQYALKSELPNVPVQSVNGKTGAVSLSASDVGALSATAQAADSAKLGGKTWAERMLEIYPVGRIYISVNETSPASLFGGTWEQIKDCFLLGAGGSYELGSTGGEATHKLTEDELPALRGTINVHGGENGSNYWNPVGVFAGSQTVDKYIKVSGSTLTSASSITGLDFSAGNDMPHNNMPPWKAVNIWKRVA